MKITVIGASGTVGAIVSDLLEERGHDVVRASRSTGVDLISGEGVEAALEGAEVVLELTNPPSFAPDQVASFFSVSSRNLAEAVKKAGVQHHVLVSIIGVGREDNQGYYMQAKEVQEQAVMGSGTPYTVVRAAQFHEFVEAIAETMAEGEGEHARIRANAHLFQPVAVQEVAEYVAEIAEGPARHGVVEIAGPHRLTMAAAITRVLTAKGDRRPVEADEAALYFGAQITDDSLIPHGPFRQGGISLDEWIAALR